MLSDLNLSSLAELLLPEIVGASLGCLLFVYTNKKPVEQDESQNEIKVSAAILSSVTVGLGSGALLLLFMGISLFWHSIYQH